MSRDATSPVDATDLPRTYLQVLTNPSGFFRHMPRGAEFKPAMVFLAVTGFLAGLAYFLLAMLSLKPYESMGQALLGVVIYPLVTIAMAFVSSAVIMIIWRFMGSGENYRTAFSCLAYMSAISPLTTLIDAVPKVGSLVGFAWGAYLLVAASVEVHGLTRKNAWLVFGVLGAVFYILTLVR